MNAKHWINIRYGFHALNSHINFHVAWYRSDVPTTTPHPVVLCINETIHYSNWHLILIEGLIFIMGNGS
jgi:hypothetical protein